MRLWLVMVELAPVKSGQVDVLQRMHQIIQVQELCVLSHLEAHHLDISKHTCALGHFSRMPRTLVSVE
jgi:hypothetical protein